MPVCVWQPTPGQQAVVFVQSWSPFGAGQVGPSLSERSPQLRGPPNGPPDDEDDELEDDDELDDELDVVAPSAGPPLELPPSFATVHTLVMQTSGVRHVPFAKHG